MPATAGTTPRHPKKSCALISASARASTSALVLYMANEARHVPWPKPIHQRLSAVVACAHRYAERSMIVEMLRVQAIDAEGDDRALVLGGPMDLQPIELAQARTHSPELGLVRAMRSQPICSM